VVADDGEEADRRIGRLGLAGDFRQRQGVIRAGISLKGILS
jgi:hypothetical protein